MRFLAIDLGDKRSGLALGDDETGVVTPTGVVETKSSDNDRLLEALAKKIDEYAPDALVVGLPFNMDGSEGPRAKQVRALATSLESRCALPVHFQDERLTSAQADWEMSGTGLTRGQKKGRRDALAAAAILRDFLDTRP